MKISTRGRYGVRLLLDLAREGGDSHTPLAVIAERQHISARYLEQVAVVLRRGGYIRSVKGASGGYVLAKLPVDIIIGDVLRLLEGDILVVDPYRPEENETSFQRCIRGMVYDRLNDTVAGVLDRLTLAGMIGGHDPDEGYMFFI